MAGKQNWHICMNGEGLGPLSSQTIVQMLTQNRLQFCDFCWTEGMKEWVRISELPQFRAYMPEYPSIPVPAGGSAAPKVEAADDAIEEEASEPAPAPAKVVPIRPRAAAPAVVETEAEAEPVVEAEPTRAPAPGPVGRGAAGAAVAKQAASATAPAPKVALKGVAKPVPAIEEKVAPPPHVKAKKPGRRTWRVPIDASVAVDGHGQFKVVDISEGGLLVEAGSEKIEIGDDLKLHVSSPSFAKPLDMTGLLVREEDNAGKLLYGIEFTKVNPAHKRALATYVSEKLQLDE